MFNFSATKKRKFWRRFGAAAKTKRPRFASARRNNAGVFLKKIAPAVFVFFLIYLAFFSRLFLIEDVVINGNNNIQSDDIKNVIINEIFKPVFRFIPGNNFFLNLNRDENIKTVLLNKFPEIETVKIEKKSFNGIIINVAEKRPELIWCRTNDCYYVDDNGMAITLADKIQKINGKNRFIKIIEEADYTSDEIVDGEKEEGDETNGATPLNKIEEAENAKKPDYDQKSDNKSEKFQNRIKSGDVVSDKDFIGFVVEMDKEIKENTTLEIKYYKTRGTKTRELVAYTENNINIFFDATSNAKLQAEYLRDFINKGIGEKDISKIKYIYLRADNKIFYK